MRLHPTRHARLATLFVTFIVGFTLAAPAGTSAAPAQGCADDSSGIIDKTTVWEADLLRLTNEHRTGMGLVALQLDATLTKASMWKARDMARRNYFAHDDAANGDAPARSPWDRLVACGWTSGGMRAENIAAGYRTADEVITGWLNSPGHRANIENASMRFVGFGVANGPSSTYGDYSAQMFSSVAGPVSTTPMNDSPTDETNDGSTEDGSGTDDSGEGGTRDPLELETKHSTRILAPRAQVIRTRCRGRLAVSGWCYRIVVSGRVTSNQADHRLIVLSRRAASRRLIRIAALRSASSGSFQRSIAIKPPARGTALWLRRNASTIRIGVAGTDTASGTASWTSARVTLRRR